MAQPPLQIDQLQLEPGSGYTVTLAVDNDGNLVMVDGVISGGITVSSLAGLRAVSNVYTVGAGDGVQYNTIQEALDDIPPTSSSTAPSVVLVFPGSYAEALTVEKDGVVLVGVGHVTVTSPSIAPAVLIQSSVSTTPHYFRMLNMHLVNTVVSGMCVHVLGGAGSEVGDEEIVLDSCTLEATGAGGYQVRAETANNIRITGGSFRGSSLTSWSRITQCALFAMSGVEDIVALQLEYDTGNPTPSVSTSVHTLLNCTVTGNAVVSLTGGSSLTIRNSVVGDITFNGDQVADLTGCTVGDLIINGTTAVTTTYTTRGTVAGTGTLAESSFRGSIAFAASAVESDSFAINQPDVNYFVDLDYSVGSPVVSARTTSGITVTFPGGPQTTTVAYRITRG